MTTSPRNSFEGYKLSEALYRNKDSVKMTVAILGSYTSYLGLTGFDWKSFLAALGLGILALGYKLIQDAVDYYFTEVEL